MAELQTTRFPAVLRNEEVKSLLKKYLTPDLFDELKDKKTSRGFTIWNVINNGIQKPKSSVGVYAPDEESYQTFSALFNPVIEEFHAPYKMSDGHVTDTNPNNLKTPHHLGGNEAASIVSTRIGLVRNLQGYGLSPALTKEEREEIERKVVAVLRSFTGELSGTYYPLFGMDEAERQRLAKEGVLLERDAFLDGTGANGDWPIGRGVFYNNDKTLLVWIGEEEQLNITSMETGGDVASVFGRLCRVANELEAKLGFLKTPSLGYLTGCPTGLGTGLSARVKMKLSKAPKSLEFTKTCDELNIQAVPIDGDDVWEIRSKRKLGRSEVQCVQDLYDGITRFLEIEYKAEHSSL